MKRIGWTIGWGILIASSLAGPARAQDLHFSQFYETTLLRNPALTGVFSGDYKLGVSYRSQWGSISHPYQTGLLSGEARFSMGSGEAADFLSIGLLSYYDRAGSAGMQTISLYPALNYNKSLEDAMNSYISAGFTAGFQQRSVDESKMTFDNQYQQGRFNPAAPSGEPLPIQQYSLWDLGAGISFNSTSGTEAHRPLSYYLGLSAYHLTRPRTSFQNNELIRKGVKWNLNAGMSQALSEALHWQFHLNYSRHQGQYQELIFGGLIGWDRQRIGWGDPEFSLFGGLFYRWGDALIPTVKTRFGDYSLSLSYDLNISGLRTASQYRGGVEITAMKTGLFSGGGYQRAKTICPHSFW